MELLRDSPHKVARHRSRIHLPHLPRSPVRPLHDLRVTRVTRVI